MKKTAKDTPPAIRKNVRLKRQRDGSFRDHWYGQYQMDGKHREVNLNVKWRGTPPESGSIRLPGDARFEASRREAEKALVAHVEEDRHKGRAEHLTERLIESKTGRAVEYARIEELPGRWRSLGRETPVSERYLVGCDARFRRFIDFMRKQNRAAAYLYEVTPEDTAAFVRDLRKQLARSSAGATVRLFNKAFSRFLPVGAANPFAAFVGTRGNGKGETIHRRPFSPEELKALLDAARDDAFMSPLITAAACTGMRRGDVCKLKWSAVDLAGGMLAVKTSKTEANVEIPIFRPILAVLKDAKSNGSEYVFPSAARMLKENPNGLTWRFKKIVAAAFAEDDADSEDGSELVPAGEIEAEAAETVRKGIPEGERRDRMLDVLSRYCAGASYRQIVEATGYCKATISTDLHTIEDMVGKRFLRAQADSVKHGIRKLTRIERENGQRAASVRDWHALRATFVTLALAAGVPVELVRRVTGHATVDVVLKHYFRPDREQFRAALTEAMPGILTGGKRKRLKPADELAALAGRIAAGTATDQDKDRLKKLAAKM